MPNATPSLLTLVFGARYHWPDFHVPCFLHSPRAYIDSRAQFTPLPLRLMTPTSLPASRALPCCLALPHRPSRRASWADPLHSSEIIHARTRSSGAQTMPHFGGRLLALFWVQGACLAYPPHYPSAFALASPSPPPSPPTDESDLAWYATPRPQAAPVLIRVRIRALAEMEIRGCGCGCPREHIPFLTALEAGFPRLSTLASLSSSYADAVGTLRGSGYYFGCGCALARQWDGDVEFARRCAHGLRSYRQPSRPQLSQMSMEKWGSTYVLPWSSWSLSSVGQLQIRMGQPYMGTALASASATDTKLEE
ncbi:hypothetical protein B0H13DRAFT_2350253 [Mycena leptocephala]|nr:hypothetical protein B0H13DRAFT_2350253 [Mycena leptocephala]